MYWAEEDINNILIIAQLRLRLGLVLAFICSITSVNGLSYFVNTDYRNTTWCTFQVDPGGNWTFRSQDHSLPGANGPGVELSLPGTFAPWNFRSLELSLPGTFAPTNKF